MKKRKFTKFRKSAIAALCAVAVTCTGLAAACTPDEKENNDSSNPRKEDTQLLKNGDFEYFDIPENAEYLIRNVNNWSRSGDSSGAMSGIIGTSASAWEKMSDYELKNKLDANNDLSEGDSGYEENYVDYNGMDSGDILYIEPYAAALASDKIGDDEDGYAKDDLILAGGKQVQRSYKDFLGITESDGSYKFRDKDVYFDSDGGDYYFDSDFTRSVRYAVINNPETHLGGYSEKDGKYYLGDTEILVDEDGNYYIDTDADGKIDVLKDQSVGNVLMIHNYPTNAKYNGIEQHYTSQSITLEANTAAEISLWVKTSDLKFDKGFLLDRNEQDRGAYIEITQSVGSSSVDSFKIKAINTEKIIANAADDSVDLGENESNGWLKYTIYVNACDFANSTISINLGLGDADATEKVTGYAFFDDVQVTKYIDLGDENEGSTYSANKDKLKLGTDEASYCSLISETDDKIFYADKQVRGGNDERFSNRFHYLVDLASEESIVSGVSDKKPVAFDNAGLEVSAALTTTETASGKIYASAETNEAKINSGITSILKPDNKDKYDLPDSLKNPNIGRPTFNDFIGIYSSATTFGAADFNGTDSGELKFRDLSARLNSALTGDNGINAISKFCLEDSDSMLVILSAYGAAYTTTIANAEGSNLFSVAGTADAGDLNYKIISFWVKTSDMGGNTAATVKIVDATDKDNNAAITVDTTDIKTDVGENEDIYGGWVQCFFFVSNELEENKDFKIEFSFGNTDIANTTGTSYTPGWAAIANVQTLDVGEDVYDIVSEGTYAKMLTFTEETPAVNTPFDEASRMTKIKDGIATPSNWYGVNGGSSYVTDKEFGDDYDKQNNYKDGITGLISREYFENYTAAGKDWQTIARAFGATDFSSATAAWNEVFGAECYQPLIIVDSLRSYYDRVTADEDYIKEHIGEYFVKDAEGNYVSAAGKEYDKNETYYSARQLAKNYGYIGNSQTIDADSYKTISIKVMVTGDATAWIYLVDSSSYEVMDFELPDYTYYYDNEGNVLSEEYDSEWSDADHRAAIVYTLRDDGLYDGEDGGVYANLSNLTKRFKYAKFENNTFYMIDGNGDKVQVSYEELEDGVTYYSDSDCTKVASHYLCVDSQRVYEYDGESGVYYYLANGERSVEVKNFNTDYARYAAADNATPEYAVKVGNTGADENGRPKWVNVNFIIHTGDTAKNFRLELWSGERGETGVTDGEDTAVNGAVAFDYSTLNITDSNYSSIIGEYETAIKDVYRELIIDNDGVDKLKNDMNIVELEKVLSDLNVSEADRLQALENAGVDKDFVARYYTFSWYDSAKYVPFNRETAEAGQTGYDYTPSSYSETLVYFQSRNYSDDSYNVFVDYSAVEQSLSITSTDDAEENEDTEENNENGQSPWLLITSIVLVVVLLFALIAIFVRYLWKNYSLKRGQKRIQNNNYKKRDRYMRKLGLIKTAPVEETPAEGTPAEGTPAEETPAEETPAEGTPTEGTPAEGTPAEGTPAEETPAEETPAEGTSAEGENKDE